jgi:hypothetical protein
MKYLSFVIAAILTINSSAQNKPYYYTIPDTPKVYTAATVAARLVDGLGFRYFWATEGLTEKDLAFKPTDSARTTLETIEHIRGLTNLLFNAVNKKPTDFSNPSPKLSFKELREATLKNIQGASEALKMPGVDLAEMDMIFQRGSNKTEFPFWNLINGPIADALWHVGQVVTFRRSSGNPLPKGVEVLTGRKTNQGTGE